MAALPGFLLVFTAEGKLLYLSESVSEHLGHSMVRAEDPLKPRLGEGAVSFCFLRNWELLGETAFATPTNGYFFFPFLQVDLVAQGDSIYDIIDPADHLTVRQQLAMPSALDTGEGSLPSTVHSLLCSSISTALLKSSLYSHTDRLFRCRFNTSKSLRRQSAGNKLVLIRGRFHAHPPGAYWAGNPVFTAFCAPLEPRPRPGPGPGPGPASLFLAMFQSRHAKDLAILDISER